jgi:hypothetical protein
LTRRHCLDVIGTAPKTATTVRITYRIVIGPWADSFIVNVPVRNGRWDVLLKLPDYVLKAPNPGRVTVQAFNKKTKRAYGTQAGKIVTKTR